MVDAALVLGGFEAAGDFVDLMTGGARAAAEDAAVDAIAALACDVLVALALTLGLDDAPLAGHGAQVLALLAKLGAPYWAALLACLLAGPLVLRWEAPPPARRGERPRAVTRRPIPCRRGSAAHIFQPVTRGSSIAWPPRNEEGTPVAVPASVR